MSLEASVAKDQFKLWCKAKRNFSDYSIAICKQHDTDSVLIFVNFYKIIKKRSESTTSLF